jgi:outer membrane protein
MSRAKDLTLDDCIDMALKNRASIIAVRGQAELAKWNVRTALGQFLPRADASWSSIKSQLRSRHETDEYGGISSSSDLPDQDNTTTRLNVGANWGFSLPDAILNFKSARLDRQGAELDVIGSEQDLILAVKSVYYGYLAAIQNQTVSSEAVKRSEEQLKLIQSRFELGSAALSDVLKQKVLYGNDQLGLLQANNSVITTKADLAYTIGLDPQQEQVFSTEYSVRQYDGSLADAIDFGLHHKPSLLSQEKALASSKTQYTRALSDYLPKIGPTASYGYSWAKIHSPIDTANVPPPVFLDGSSTTKQTSLTYGLELSWNIFDGFQRERSVASAKISRNNANAALADLRNLVASQIKTAYLNIQQLKEQKNVSQSNVDASTEDLKITQEKYNLGAATILDLLNAQVSLRQAQVTLIQADFDLNLAISRLENAMGKM